ncbi:phage holin family protein [Nonomuraea sp. NPDC049714]|uniref:phage holin family protein n=1 Tax=Nonomuraea sp. NPDC049714 TaxID=3364357 RepID=UPI0037A2D99E
MTLPTTPAAPQPAPEAALADLARLALQLGTATGLPAITLAVSPGVDVDPDVDPLVGVQETDCHPATVLHVDQALLYADPDSPAGRAAAGALAHEIVCAATPFTRVGVWLDRALPVLIVALAAGLGLAWPAWLAGLLVALVGLTLLGRAVVVGAREAFVDDVAANRLTTFGLDGDACITAMFDQHAATTTRAEQLLDLVQYGTPTITMRRRALSHARTQAGQSAA